MWPQMAANVVPNYLSRGVQYLRYDQIPLTVDSFSRFTAPCIGSLVYVHSCYCTVSNSLEISRAELVLN